MEAKVNYRGLMSLVVVAGLLMACAPRREADASRNGAVSIMGNNTQLGLPRVGAKSTYEHWHLLVNKSGEKRWNGQEVDTDTLRRYMSELSEMPSSAGKLVVHIEPGTSGEIIQQIKVIVSGSPLCSRGRCLQDRWDYTRPIVN